MSDAGRWGLIKGSVVDVDITRDLGGGGWWTCCSGEDLVALTKSNPLGWTYRLIYMRCDWPDPICCCLRPRTVVSSAREFLRLFCLSSSSILNCIRAHFIVGELELQV